jgi:serine/threonine protein kinase
MGEVYRARDTRLDRTVAIKILPVAFAADPQFRERFAREARTISQLDHPHICALHDVGEQDGTAYLVMQYLDGDTLDQRLAHGPLPLSEAVRVAIELADALDKAHRAGVIHRDLKPSNVKLTKSGAKLLDFGLAKTTAPLITGAAVTLAPTTPAGLTAQGTKEQAMISTSTAGPRRTRHPPARRGWRRPPPPSTATGGRLLRSPLAWPR